MKFSTNKRYSIITIILCMLYLTFLFVAVLMGYKMITLGKSVESGSVFIFPLTYFIGDIIAEIYGFRLARNLIIMAIICEFLFVALSYFVNILPYHGPIYYQASYNVIVPLLLRVFLCSFITTFISEILNVYIISKLKVLTKGKYFWMRSLGSSGFALLLYCFIASFIAFTGILPISKILNLGISAFLFSELIIFIFSFFSIPIVYFLRQTEGPYIEPSVSKFNPFTSE